MSAVTSKDGTSIAFDQIGQGPPVVLVDGALCHRGLGPMAELARLLAPHLTVVTYDRRGRGESGDTQPYTVEREIEDIEALINSLGGRACLCGVSAGAALALEAAIGLGTKVEKLAMYEAPYDSDDSALQESKGFLKELTKLLAADRRGEAVELFLSTIGMSEEALGGMRQTPMWSMCEAVAPTLAYDCMVLGQDGSVPTERAASVAVPTLVMDGGPTHDFMHKTAKALAKSIPRAQHRVLDGQPQPGQVAAEVAAPALVAFFAAQD